MPEKANIVGTERSGLSLLGAMLDCPVSTTVSDGAQLASIFDKEHKELEGISLFSITREHFLKYKTRILDGLLLLKESATPTIWIVRDPVPSVCSYMINLGMSGDEAFEYWHQVNCMLWYFYSMSDPSKRLLIKFEDLLLNPMEARSAFEICGLEFSRQFVRYGDFDHQYPNVPNISTGQPQIEHVDPYPKTAEMQESWRQYKNEQLIRWLGYNRVNMD